MGWLSGLEDITVRGVPLLVIGLCGMAGVLVDLDHYGNRGRRWHKWYWVVCSVVLCSAIALG
jgi:hypothetical protein